MSKVIWRIAPLREGLKSSNHTLHERVRMAPNELPQPVGLECRGLHGACPGTSNDPASPHPVLGGA